jgi:hypothetical protein
MFAFNPPTKIARTQRSSTVSDFTAADVSAVSELSRTGAGEAAAPKLSGIGTTISWIVRSPNQVAIYDHSLLSTQQRSKVDISSRHEVLPEFQQDESEAAFSAELAAQRTVAFCTRRGTVISADKFLQLNFADNHGNMEVSAFDCSSTRNRCVAAVGTTDGAVLVGTLSAGNDLPIQSFRIDRGSLGEKGTTESEAAKNRGSWWGWLSKGRGTQQQNSSVSAAAEEGGPCAVSMVRFSLSDGRRLFATTASGQVLMLLMNDSTALAPLTPAWTLSPRDAACVGREQTTPKITIVAVTDSQDLVALLVAVESSIRGAPAAAFIVCVAAASGVVLSSTPIAHQGLFGAESPQPGAATIAIDTLLHAQMVVVLGRNVLVRVNVSVGIRSPCAAEDVKTYEQASDALTAGAMLPAPDRRVILLLPRRPLVVEGHDNSSAGVLSLGTVSHAQKLANIRQSFRADCNHTCEEACLHEVEEILSVTSAHDANWARADLEMEDANLLTHVTRSVQRRREQLEEFVKLLLSQPDIRGALSDRCIEQLVSCVDQMIALEAVRHLQNYVPRSAESSGRQRPVGDAPPDAIIDIDNDEGHQVQLVLKDAVRFVVAEIRRTAATPLDPNMSATEIFYSKPHNVILLLEALNSHILSIFSFAEGVNVGERFNTAVAVGIVFHAVSQKLLQFWSHDAVLGVRHILWSSANDSAAAQQTSDNIFSQQSLILSDALALLSSSPDLQGLSRRPRLQSHFLEALAKLLHLQLRQLPSASPDEAMRLGSSAVRRTMFRAPFLARPTGFPYGSPQPSSENPIFSLVLERVETIAREYSLFDILFDFLLADYHATPTARDFEKFFSYARDPEEMHGAIGLVEYAARQLALSAREQDLALLYANIPQQSLVRTMLQRDFPHMLRRLEPQCVPEILCEGAVDTSATALYLAYADNPLEHLSRCVALAKLANAAGASSHAAHQMIQRHEQLVSVQRDYLGTTERIVPPQLLVQELMQWKPPTAAVSEPNRRSVQQAWVEAVGIAESIEDVSVRGELLTEILRRAYSLERSKLDGILRENPSEVETSARLNVTLVGRVLRGSRILTQQREFHGVVSAAEIPEEIAKLLWSWLAHA